MDDGGLQGGGGPEAGGASIAAIGTRSPRSRRRSNGGRKMPEGAEPLLTTSEIRKRVQRFASLRAAQRALNRSLHPSELALANQQGRQILIELQSLTNRAEGAERSPRSEPEKASDLDDLHRVDLLLHDISLRTRELLDGLEIYHLRSTAPLIAAQHPDEVRGLIDLLLEADLEDDKNLRMLEYLITVLSSEERDGRRILVREPIEVSARLREVGQRQVAAGDAEYLVAEKTFDTTLRMAHEDPDIGATRDRIRRYKESLGSRVLHPRILQAAVSYNVSMWNRVAGLVDGGRSIDCLADDLFGAEPAEEGPDPIAEPPSPPADAPDVLASKGFERIVSALRDRLGRRPVSDDLARSVIAAYELDPLDDAERDAFAGEDEVARLTRRAVALGLTLRHEAQVDDLLHALRVDPAQLRTVGVDRLKQEMSELARELFAQGRHDEAFRLSEVKTRNLPSLSAASAGAAAQAAAAGCTRGRSGIFHVDWGLPAGQAWVALLLLMLPLIAALVWSSAKGVSLIPAEDLSQISPFLESGYRRQRGEQTEFVGHVNRGWDYLGRSERLRVTAEIGLAFKSQGVERVVLQDRWAIVQARYVDGEPVLESLPQLAPPPETYGSRGGQGARIERSVTRLQRSPATYISKSKPGS